MVDPLPCGRVLGVPLAVLVVAIIVPTVVKLAA
jgi:hypothetical protein